MNTNKTTTTNLNLEGKKLYEVAAIIKDNWSNVYFGAVPYLEAMAAMENIYSRYGLDSAASIVSYFLANAQTWRGETARQVKKYLKSITDEYYNKGKELFWNSYKKVEKKKQ